MRAALKAVDGVQTALVVLDLDQGGLRELGGRVKGLSDDLALVLLGRDGEKAPWIVVAQGKALEDGWDARAAARFLAAQVGGGGGGKPDLAQGQGQRAAAREDARTAFDADPRAAFRG